jgi:hypothetical protein
MPRLTVFVGALVVAAACDSPKRAPAIGTPEPVSAQQSDSAFKAMDERHAEMIGDDPMALEHQFVQQPDGGDIILERQIHEDMGINQIRAHLLLIARSFSRGDFSLPGFVHEKPVPGTTVMADRADRISYTVEDLEHGGVVHIRTTDPEALKAIHSFIAFQIAEHRTAH